MEIGPPPEFGKDGSSPPATSAPINIANWTVNKSVRRFLRPQAGDDVGWQVGTLPWWSRNSLAVSVVFTAAGLMQGATDLLKNLTASKASQEEKEEEAAVSRMITEIQRQIKGTDLDQVTVSQWQVYAVHEHFWRREDPVTQLPPGGSSEITMSLRIGVSEECATEVARSLGMTGTAPYVSISAQLSNKGSTKIIISREKEVTRKITLTNPREDTYRRLAIWHVVNRLSIVAKPDLTSDQRIICQETEFILSDAANVTFMDVARLYKFWASNTSVSRWSGDGTCAL